MQGQPSDVKLWDMFKEQPTCHAPQTRLELAPLCLMFKTKMMSTTLQASHWLACQPGRHCFVFNKDRLLVKDCFRLDARAASAAGQRAHLQNKHGPHLLHCSYLQYSRCQWHKKEYLLLLAQSKHSGSIEWHIHAWKRCCLS